MTDVERVRLAAAQFTSRAAQEAAIFGSFGSVTAFWQRVNVAIDDPGVMAVVPVEGRLLRERREASTRSRQTL